MAENAVTLVTCLHITITYFEFYIYTRKSNNIKIQIIYGKDNNKQRNRQHQYWCL